MKVWHLIGGRPIGPTYEIVTVEPEPIKDTEDCPNQYGMTWEETTLDQVLEQFKRHCIFEQDRKGLTLQMKFIP